VDGPLHNLGKPTLLFGDTKDTAEKLSARIG